MFDDALENRTYGDWSELYTPLDGLEFEGHPEETDEESVTASWIERMIDDRYYEGMIEEDA